ncbi:hypothetical protein BGZ65_012685, partial [Modicella reniformis]
TPEKTAKRKPDKPASTDEKSGKHPRLERRPAMKQAPISTTPASVVVVSSKPATAAVLLARPQPIQKTSTSSSNAKTSGPVSAASGPPVLKIDLRAHSKPQFRQAVATQYYNEFLRIYAPLGDAGSGLTTAHAVDQEKAVHSKTNQGSYRSLAATVLQRLKKRPLATNKDDVGIDGVWVDLGQRSKDDDALDEVWKGASKFVQTLEELEAGGYPIAIPEGIPPPLGT